LNIEDLLLRLDKVKKTGPGKWHARCPAHEDRSPSLSIAEKDGTILLHCFGACSVEDVCGAIGVELSELFPPSDKSGWVSQERPVKFGGMKFSAIDALRCLGAEGSVLCLVAADLAEGKVLTPDERERLYTATSRILAAMDYLGINLAE
jgi:hypothetical protein